MIRALKELLFKKALESGFTDCELYYSKQKSFEVKIFQGAISDFKNTESQGISFRGTYHNVMGYSYSEKLSLDIVDRLISEAKNNASVVESEEREILYKGDASYPEVQNYNDTLNQVTVEEKIRSAKKMEKLAYEADTRVKSVDYCIVGSGESEVFISNSCGLDVQNKSNYCLAYVVARVEEKGQVKVGSEFWVGNDYAKFSPEKLAKVAVEKATSSLGADTVPSGKNKIMIQNESFIDLLSAFSSAFYGEQVQKGFSLLKGKLGQIIANELVTIHDDALLENHLGSTPFDSEGVKTANKVIVEKGILKTFLHNLKSAQKDGVSSTGNGFKNSFKSYVNTAATNFYMEKGTDTFDQLLQKVGDGILITDLAGLHSGINVISGDFSLSATGFLIGDGKIQQPVEQITIAGNFFELLMHIEAIGEDLIFGIPSSGGNVGAPSVYVGTLAVAGK